METRFQKAESGLVIGNSSRDVIAGPAKAAPKLRLASKTGANGTCAARPPAADAGDLLTTYPFGVGVRAKLTSRTSAPRCVTSGQGAPVNSVRLGVSSGTRVTWSLHAAAKRPKTPRGCKSGVRWPKLAAAKKTLATGTVTGTGTTRTTSMAKILPAARLAKLKPGFYRVSFTASANSLVSAPLDWWIQVLPRELMIGS